MKLLACPVCNDPLSRFEGALKCRSNHSYDIARGGYVNLLPAQHRRSRQPGDNAGMVAARTRFLNRGHYQPLVDSLHETINDARLGGPLVDLGCGEGYFTCALAKGISDVYGVDVSKPSIKAACKRDKSISWVVGTVSRLPLVDAAFSTATVLMAPLSPDVARVLPPGGKLCRVTPAANHLRELKRLLYREVQAHDRADIDLTYFDLQRSTRVTFSAALGIEDLQELVGMTPMRYRARKSLAETVCDSDITRVTFDFWIDVFEKHQ